jgi:hypothetical protein
LSALVSKDGRACVVAASKKMASLLSAKAHQNRIRHHAVAIGEPHPAGIADRDDGADQMLVEPHAAGDTVHDHAKTFCRHIDCSCRIFAFGC